MASNTISSDEQSARQLRQFLAWVTPTVFGFAAVLGTIAVIFGDLWLGVLVLILCIEACLLLVARIWVGRGAIKPGVALICISLLALDLLISALEPFSSPMLVILPLLVAAQPPLAAQLLPPQPRRTIL